MAPSACSSTHTEPLGQVAPSPIGAPRSWSLASSGLISSPWVDQPVRLVAAGVRQRALVVRSVPLPLVAGVGVTDQVAHPTPSRLAPTAGYSRRLPGPSPACCHELWPF